MDTEILYTIATYVSGFFDFLVFVGVLVLALTVVRKADATCGYVLAAGMGVNFLASCCSRGVYSAQSSMGEAGVMVGAGIAIVRPFFELVLWGAVIFVLVQLSKKIPGTGAPS